MLRRAPLFAELDGDELALVASAMNENHTPAGAVLTAEGGPADGFFVIAAGDADVSADGRSISTLGAGDFFGEIALMTGGSRTATVTATTDMHCYALTPEDFRELVEDHPDIAWKVMQAMAERLEQ